jgi:hypothetical protein
MAEIGNEDGFQIVGERGCAEGVEHVLDLRPRGAVLRDPSVLGQGQELAERGVV